jgi:hypothetical protein
MASNANELLIGIDFDGTIVKHMFPAIGDPVEGALEKLKNWQEKGHKLILWTMRSGNTLDEAVDYLTRNGITLFGINENPTQKEWTSSPKAYCQVYVDDAAYGCPLIYPKDERPYVDWSKICFCGVKGLTTCDCR